MACLKENIRLENQKNSLIQINNELQKAIKEKKECVPDGKGKVIILVIRMDYTALIRNRMKLQFK